MTEAASEIHMDRIRDDVRRAFEDIARLREARAGQDVAMKELKARMEDALYATKASIDEGIVPGGGLAYLRAAQHVRETLQAKEEGDLTEIPFALPENDEEWAGFRLVLDACDEPMRQIVTNAGKLGGLYVEKVKEQEDYVGVDVADMKFKNLLEAGIIDPTKVVRSALANAVSVVGTLLLTEALLRKPERKQGQAAL